MSNDVHIFRCYPLVIADPIEVEASSREDAERKAAAHFACSERKVFARYVRTLGSRAPELARAIYAVLVAGCDADPSSCREFINWLATVDDSFIWQLPQGEFRIGHEGIYVVTTQDDLSTNAKFIRTMRALAVLMEKA